MERMGLTDTCNVVTNISQPKIQRVLIDVLDDRSYISSIRVRIQRMSRPGRVQQRLSSLYTDDADVNYN